jgi:hypothetical protein
MTNEVETEKHNLRHSLLFRNKHFIYLFHPIGIHCGAPFRFIVVQQHYNVKRGHKLKIPNVTKNAISLFTPEEITPGLWSGNGET